MESKLTVYGAYWCPDCRRSKKFLGENFIPFNWVDIEENKEGEAFVIAKNGGKRIIPTIVFEDGSFLVEPSNAKLAKKLNLKTEAKKTFYDLIIIGGGPAGLTASIYASREGAETLLIERSGIGGQAGITVGLISLVFQKASVGRNSRNVSPSRQNALVWKFCRRRMLKDLKRMMATTKSTLLMESIITPVLY